MERRVRARLILPGAILPATLVAMFLAPTPAMANHSDGTYAGTSASNGSVTLMVSGNTLNVSVTDPCGGSDSGQTTIGGPNHTFNFFDGIDFAILGEFHQPNQARGNYQVTMGCPLTTWTADIPPTIDIGDATSKEGRHWAEFPVQLSHPVQAPVQIDIQTMNGSAVAGKDYLSVSGTMLFMPGETQKQIRVPVLDDSKHDKKKKERFRVILFNPQGATIADADGTGSIIDNDRTREQLSGCQCQDFNFLKPKKKPEAFLFKVGALRFVNLKIPVRYKILCSMGPLGCAAYYFLDEEFTVVDWNTGPIQDLHVLPKVLGCGGPCNGKWTEGETGFIYTGRVLGPDPTSGVLRFRYRNTCGDARLTVEATVTFPHGLELLVDAVPGEVEIEYHFG